MALHTVIRPPTQNGVPEQGAASPRRHRTDIANDGGLHVAHDGDPDSEFEPPASTLQRLGWFALLWIGGVACVTAVGYAIRLAIVP